MRARSDGRDQRAPAAGKEQKSNFPNLDMSNPVLFLYHSLPTNYTKGTLLEHGSEREMKGCNTRIQFHVAIRVASH